MPLGLQARAVGELVSKPCNDFTVDVSDNLHSAKLLCPEEASTLPSTLQARLFTWRLEPGKVESSLPVDGSHSFTLEEPTPEGKTCVGLGWRHRECVERCKTANGVASER